MSLLNLLLEQKLFDQIQTILEQFKNYDLTPAQRTELKNFYKKYYKTYTATSLQDKDYKYALMGAKAGLQMMPNDLGLMESGGWAALNGGQYPDAVYFFSKIIAQKPDAYSQMYGLGLAYVNMKEMEKAKVAFKDAEKTPDRDLLYKIAGIYKDIGLKKDAYRVIKMLEKSSQKPKPSAAPAPASNEPTEEELSVAPPPKDPVPEAGDSQRDNLNTFNPFLSEVEKPPPPPPPVQKPKPEPKPNIEPMQQAEPVKKKSGRWF
jgi:tetratricopeptide (TPR) repeat protein